MISRGQVNDVKKKYKYDDMYHLYVIITFENGQKYELQKNQIVEIKPFKSKLQKDSECKDRVLNNKPNFNYVLSELEKKYPDSLYLYQGWNYNCQDFLNKFTKECGINLAPFIMQYWNQPFEKKHMRKIARFVTDLSASVQRYIFGKGLEDDL
jgi:hypothetical protein